MLIAAANTPRRLPGECRAGQRPGSPPAPHTDRELHPRPHGAGPAAGKGARKGHRQNRPRPGQRSFGNPGSAGRFWAQERTGAVIREHKQNADRTEKEIFGIFGIINTIKITNGKVSEVASLVLTRNRKVFSLFFFFFHFFSFSFFSFHTQKFILGSS